MERVITINGTPYTITITEFDDKSEPDAHGMYEYRYVGKNVHIEGGGLVVRSRLYDNSHELSISHGIEPSDKSRIETVRSIAKELFGIDKLLLLSSGDPPYKPV